MKINIFFKIPILLISLIYFSGCSGGSGKPPNNNSQEYSTNTSNANNTSTGSNTANGSNTSNDSSENNNTINNNPKNNNDSPQPPKMRCAP